MSENNLPNLEENNVELNEEVVENEVVEEAEATGVEAEAEIEVEAEEALEDAEFVQDEATEECDVACDCGCDCAEEQLQWGEEPVFVKKNNVTAAAIIGIVAALILVIAGLLVWYINKPLPLPAVVDITGQTVADIAEVRGLDVEDFLYQYHLPEYMTAETSIAEAEMSLPLRQVAVMNNYSLQKFREERNIPDEITGEGNFLDAILKVFGINRYKITGNTPYALVEGELRLEDYVGDVEAFKAQYELGDEVTGDTKWKEVRDVVLAKDKADYEAQQEAMDAAIAQDQAASATTETEVAVEEAVQQAVEQAIEQAAE